MQAASVCFARADLCPAAWVTPMSLVNPQLPSGSDAAGGTWHTIAEIEEVPEGPSLWHTSHAEVLIVRQHECLYALDDSCPHAGASLRSGRFKSEQVQCRAHGLRFNLATGQSLVGGLVLTLFPVRVHNRRLEVLLPSTSAGASTT